MSRRLWFALFGGVTLGVEGTILVLEVVRVLNPLSLWSEIMFPGVNVVSLVAWRRGSR